MVDMQNLRKNKGLTQAELAERCGVARQTICEIERGNRKPSIPLAKKLGKLLNVAWYTFYD